MLAIAGYGAWLLRRRRAHRFVVRARDPKNSVVSDGDSVLSGDTKIGMTVYENGDKKSVV